MSKPLIVPARLQPRLDPSYGALILHRIRDEVLTCVTGQAVNFDRTGPRSAIDARGSIITVPRRFPRVEMYDLDGDFECETPALALAPAGANRLLRSNDLANGTWTQTSTPTLSAPTITLGSIVLSLLVDNDGATAEQWQQSLTPGGSAGAVGVALVVAKGTSAPAAGSGLTVFDNTATATRLDATINWSGTAPTSAIVGGNGTYLGALFLGRRYDSSGVLRDVYLLLYRTTAAYNPANVHHFRFRPANTAAQQGNIFGGFFALDTARTPSTPIITTTAAVTANAETCTVTSNVLPRQCTVFVRMVEVGSVSDANARVWCIGTPGVGPYLLIESSGTVYRAIHHNGSSSVTATLGAAPAFGADVQLRVSLDWDGSLTIGQTVNGGTETMATAAANTLAAAWSAPLITIAGTAPMSIIGWALCGGLRTQAEGLALLR